MRIRPASLALLAALTAAAPAAVPLASGAAAAPVESCQGREATVVGSGGITMGTSGDDVLVSVEGYSVRALGGDDLICVRGAPRHVTVDAGDGDDSVTIEGDGGVSLTVHAILGTGDDRFVGGPGPDTVTDLDPNGGDDAVGGSLPDSGDDIIRTLGGNDVVDAGGRTGPPQTDGIDLGDGGDVLRIGNSGTTADSRLRGGPGVDRLLVYGVPDQRTVLDLGARRATVLRQRVLARDWVDFQYYRMEIQPTVDQLFWVEPPLSITVRGSIGPDEVDLDTSRDEYPPVVLDVALLGSDDHLTLSPGVRGSVNGGDGRDAIGVRGSGATRIDLARGRLTSLGARVVSIARFQDAFLVTAVRESNVLVGDADDNRLLGCATVHGGGGNDTVGYAEVPGDECRGGVRAYGGPGRDRLIGSPGNDVLNGGPAYDTANGGGGTDTCMAERKASCER